MAFGSKNDSKAVNLLVSFHVSVNLVKNVVKTTHILMFQQEVCRIDGVKGDEMKSKMWGTNESDSFLKHSVLAGFIFPTELNRRQFGILVT